MLKELSELWRFRELLRQMVARELRVRYKNSIFGFLWSIVPPLLQVIVYTFLIKRVLVVGGGNLSAYILCGLLPWTFFTTAILDTCQSLLVNYSIIKKIYLPREIIPLSFVISNFIHYLMAWGVYFVVFFGLLRLIHKGVPILPTILWFPVITAVLLLLVTGLSLWFSALNVFYEDVKFILATLFGLLLFLLPVIYTSENIGYLPVMQKYPWLFKLYMINPITAIITAYRKTLLERPPPGAFNVSGPFLAMDWTAFGIASVISLLVAVSGYWYFNRRKWQFVERP